VAVRPLKLRRRTCPCGQLSQRADEEESLEATNWMPLMSHLSDLSNSLTSLAAEFGPRVLAIQGADGREFSGFIWRTGLAVTAEEVLEGEDEVQVLDATGKVSTAKIAGRDPSTDVALLKLETADFADWAEAGPVQPGSLAVAIGRSEQSLIVRLAPVSAVGPAWKSRRGGKIDARVGLDIRPSRRSEGGVVVAPDGKLLGMAVTAIGRQAIAIPTSTIAQAVSVLLDKGYVPRGWLGVMLQPLPEGGGAIILSIEKGSPASGAALLVGDILTTWNGELLNSPGDVANRLGAGSVGAKAKLGVSRGGTISGYDITIAERPRK
jgi:S1-C subfamily serine protease